AIIGQSLESGRLVTRSYLRPASRADNEVGSGSARDAARPSKIGKNERLIVVGADSARSRKPRQDRRRRRRGAAPSRVTAASGAPAPTGHRRPCRQQSQRNL